MQNHNTTQMNVKTIKRRYIVLLAIFCLITFFVNREALPTDIMESRNLVTAREMVSDGNWLVPTMNGELRLEKPPLPTWVAGVIEMWFPDNLGAQRTAPGIMGCLWTVYLFLFVRYMSRREDLAAATTVVFLTCYNLVLMGRSATWDIYCHAFMMAAIYYLTRALYEEHHYRQRFVLAGVFMGLSFLSKGPVSFYALLLPYIITMIALPRPSMKGKWGAFILMAVMVLALSSWWYIYLLIAEQEKVSAVIHKETSAWRGHNVRPWYYYWRFFLEMGAWSLLMLAALFVPYWKRHITVKRDYLLSITWALGSLVLLSLMPEKKTRYLLPLLAPCSIVVGCLIVHFKQGRQMDKAGKWLYRGNGIIMTLIVLAVPALAYKYGVKAGIISIGTECVVSVCLLLVAAWLAWSTLRYRPMSFITGIAVLFALVELVLLKTVGNTFVNHDAHSIATVRTDKRVDGVPFYYNEDEPLRIEFVYEAHRKILPLDFTNQKAVEGALPCVMISEDWAGGTLPPTILAKIDTVEIGTFDNNKLSKGKSHYTKDLVRHATLLKRKAAR